MEIECKNNKLIKDRILSSLDENYIDSEVKNLSLKNLINYIYNMDILESTLNKSNINFIINIEFIEGGFNFKTNDFSFEIDRGEDKSEYYAELSKMYGILANKNDYDLYVEVQN